ncbi:MAG: ATP-dependent DNA ligase [Actinomycetales bacterium]|nr:ATP-dependent DNA ligase [Actinomycetales bacterium]
MLTPPIEPMLAAPLGSTLPDEPGISFEPKWDGFRCLVFVDEQGEVVLQGRGRSKSADEIVDLAYAFPEVVAAIRGQVPRGTVLDGEIVIQHDGRLDFGVLSSRLRPRSEAEGSNIARLAAEYPATLLLFDALWSEGDLTSEAFGSRRSVLETLASSWEPPILLTPNTIDRAVAESWFVGYESAGVDGLIVKPVADPYLPGKRAQGKVKHLRSADVVVAGWRAYTKPGPEGEPIVGSLLLGLYDEGGRLHYVGGASAFTAKKRRELVDLLAPLASAEDEPHPWRGTSGIRIPGTANRWKKEQPWVALRPELVAEVEYDQMEGDRFRHGVSFARWRPDRGPTTCGFDQLEVPPAASISGLLSPS